MRRDPLPVPAPRAPNAARLAHAALAAVDPAAAAAEGGGWRPESLRGAVAAVCEALSGCHGVPDGAAVRAAYRRQDRDARIAAAVGRGEPVAAVARRNGVSPSWARRVAAREAGA